MVLKNPLKIAHICQVGLTFQLACPKKYATKFATPNAFGLVARAYFPSELKTISKLSSCSVFHFVFCLAIISNRNVNVKSLLLYTIYALYHPKCT